MKYQSPQPQSYSAETAALITQLKDRIKRLEEAGDEMANAYEEITHDSYDQEKIANWRKVMEAKL